MAARRTRSPIPIPGVPHGRASSYTNYGCGCQPCRFAMNASSARTKRRRVANAARTLDGRPVLHGIHGTAALYVAGCRCSPCTSANSAAYRGRKAAR